MLRHIGAVCLAACAALPGVLATAAAGGDQQYYYPNGTEGAPFWKECGDIGFTPGRECSCDSTLKGIHVTLLRRGETTCTTGDLLVLPAMPAWAALDGAHSTDCKAAIAGKSTLRNYLALLKQVRFATTATDHEERVASYWLGHGWYDPTTDHYYGLHTSDDVAALAPTLAGLSETWYASQYYCAHPANDMLGMVGYLATVTDVDEFNFLKDDVNGKGAIGGSDLESEGHWAWVTGPEGCPDDYDGAWTDPTLRAAPSTDDVLRRSLCPFGNQLVSGPLRTGKGRAASIPCVSQTGKTPCCTMDTAVAYESGTMPQCSAGPNMGTRFWDGPDPSDANHMGGVPHAVGSFGAWGVNNMDALPDHQKKDADYLRTDVGGGGTTLYFNDAIFDVPAGRFFVCEWGGVGEMCVPADDMLHEEVFVYLVDECNATCATCEEGLVCDAVGQDCFDPMPRNADNLRNWECRCRLPSAGPPERTGEANCTLNECTDPTSAAQTCALAGQGCVDEDVNAVGGWRCLCAGDAQAYGPAHGSEYVDNGVESVAACFIDECAGATGQPGPGPTYRVCETALQECVDPNWDEASPHDWMCYCPGSPRQNELRGRVGTCEPVNECIDESSAAQSNRHIPRYEAKTKCLCRRAEWAATHPGVVAGAAGSTSNPCTTGCCNPDSDPHGDWCFIDTTSPYNIALGCDVAATPQVWGYCLPAGMVPAGAAAAHLPWNRAAGTPPGTSAWESNLCTDEGQYCGDDNAAMADTWYCKCVPGQANVDAPPLLATAPAECELDECVNNTFCAAQTPAQQCNDPDKAVNGTGNWECECLVGTGAAVERGAATCELDECTANCTTCEPAAGGADSNLCAASGQACVDDGPFANSTGDWRCHCNLPNTLAAGSTTANMSLAACELDECVRVCPTCEDDGVNGETCADAGQDCVDDDKNATVAGKSDWKCHCRPPHALPTDASPLTGPDPATAEATDCVLYECDVVCGSCEQTAAAAAGTCEAVGQDCHDPNVTNAGDWYCKCRLPARGADGTAPSPVAPLCEYNECLEAPANTTCLADQRCNDTNLTDGAGGTWECQCVLPDTPVAGPYVGTAADCAYIGECQDLGAGGQGGRATCAAAGQHCVDDVSVASPTAWAWKCECVVDGVASGTDEWGAPGDQGVATCTIDECTAVCDSCEGGLCDGQYPSQECHDRNTSAQSMGDWECRCSGLASGTGAAGKPATGCMLNECAKTGATDPLAFCNDHDQDCRDDDETREGGWFCVCRGNSTDERPEDYVLACTWDECDAHGAECTGHGQRCEDENVTTANSWYCHCPEGPVGKGHMTHVDCDAYNECTKVCDGCGGTVCGEQRPAQTCEDAEPYAAQDNWRCVCAAPAAGTAADAARAARDDECVLDECVEECQTCADRGAGNRCTAAGQDCHDAVRHMGALKDWVCKCAAPLGFLEKTARAVRKCEFDECTTARPGETEPRGAVACGTQTCIDSGASLGTLGTFKCVCNGAAETGEEDGGAATCRVNECDLYGDNCTLDTSFYGLPQTCHDPEWGVRDNWLCLCPSPAGQSQKKGAASCSHNECDDAAKASQCPAGQMCVDGDNVTDDTWQCHCIVKEGTVRAPGRPATCAIDECGAHGAVCTGAGQDCKDDEPLEDGTWVCSCRDGEEGPDEVANTTTCTTPAKGDCATAGQVCVVNEQECYDPDPAVDGSDWECRCYVADPSKTVRQPGEKKPAKCDVDECTEGGRAADCGAGQYCRDDTTRTDGDWMCFCNGTNGTVGEQEAATCAAADCAALTDACACWSAAECRWDGVCTAATNASACTARADVVVLLDGSGTMAAPFGHHAHGFHAAIETLKLWVDAMPLTGGAAAAGAAAAATADGHRVAFLQFSGTWGTAEPDVIAAPGSVGTGGRFSGDAAELGADLTWHEANFMKKQTYVKEGLEKAADLLAASPGGRDRVLYVISDGQFDDRHEIAAAAARLAVLGVEVFGIVLENENADPDVNEAAVESMRALATAPHHVANLDMDHLAGPDGQALHPSGPLQPRCDPRDAFEQYGCATEDECRNATNAVICQTAEQECYDEKVAVPGDWVCRCYVGSASNKTAPVDSCPSRPETPAPTPAGTPPPTPTPTPGTGGGGTAEGADEGEGCTFWRCWWWVLLLVLLMCSSCCVLVLVLLRVKQRKEVDDEKWNEGIEDMSAEATELKQREEFKDGAEEEASRSLLFGEESREDAATSSGEGAV